MKDAPTTVPDHAAVARAKKILGKMKRDETGAKPPPPK
jgi:hypothetical protein